MIQSYINNPITLTSNDSSIAFQTDCIRNGGCSLGNRNSWLCHNCGSANYDIVCGGKYNITLTATLSSATAGDVAVALFNNGEMIPGTLRVGTLAAADDFVTVAIDKEIPVCCNGNANITLRSVPTVPTPSTITPAITTQIPIIVNANMTFKRSC